MRAIMPGSALRLLGDLDGVPLAVLDEDRLVALVLVQAATPVHLCERLALVLLEGDAAAPELLHEPLDVRDLEVGLGVLGRARRSGRVDQEPGALAALVPQAPPFVDLGGHP